MNTFERLECKYIVTEEQMMKLIEQSQNKLKKDKYHDYEIRSLYFDTDDYALVRASIAKPCYKEKLRLRSYGKASMDSPVFLELKKKYKGVVYKRRESMTLQSAIDFIKNGVKPFESQINRELDAFMNRFDVTEKALIIYDRKAWHGTEDSNLRVTFDSNVRARCECLKLDAGSGGFIILPQGLGQSPNRSGAAGTESPLLIKRYLLEIKALGALPLWLTRELADLRIYPSSFSKYGTVYEKLINTNVNPAQTFENEYDYKETEGMSNAS